MIFLYLFAYKYFCDLILIFVEIDFSDGLINRI